MPGFQRLALELKETIEGYAKSPTRIQTGVDIEIPVIGSRPSGEPYYRFGKSHVGDHDCYVLTSGPGKREMLIDTYFVLRYVAGRKPTRITLVTDYFPLGRSDKDEGVTEFALTRPVVDLFEAGARVDDATLLRRIITFDPHSDQVVNAAGTGKITPIYLVRRTLEMAFADAKERNYPVCVAYPDDGARKRFEENAEEVLKNLKLTVPFVYGSKHRHSDSTVSVEGLTGETEALKGALVINLDDEIAKFTTNLETARVYKQRGAREVWAVVIHGVFCGKAPELLADPHCPVDRAYVTDTIPVEGRTDLSELIASGKLRVNRSWHEDLANIIYYDHWGESIRAKR